MILGGNDPTALFDLLFLILAVEELAAALAGVVPAVARLRAGLLLGRGLVQLVAQRIHSGGLGGVAVLAGVGHHARLRAGGLRGRHAAVPRVGQQVAGGKGLRALRAAGAGLVVRGLLGAGGRGGQIAVRGHFLIVSVSDQQDALFDYTFDRYTIHGSYLCSRPIHVNHKSAAVRCGVKYCKGQCCKSARLGNILVSIAGKHTVFRAAGIAVAEHTVPL